MSLSQWCQTHSLKEFMELMKENNKGNNMNEVINLEGVIDTQFTPSEAAVSVDTAAPAVVTAPESTEELVPVYVQEDPVAEAVLI